MLHITMLRAAQKNKKIFHKVVKLRTKIIWNPQKYVVATTTKKIVTPKRDSCWLNLFGAQKLKTYCQKIFSVVYKYVLLIRKVLRRSENTFWYRTKIKVGMHKYY